MWVISHAGDYRKSNFLKIGNGWAIIVKYAKTVLYVGTHFFPQFLENSRSHSNACMQLNVLKKARTYEKYAWCYQWPSDIGEI